MKKNNSKKTRQKAPFSKELSAKLTEDYEIPVADDVDATPFGKGGLSKECFFSFCFIIYHVKIYKTFGLNMTCCRHICFDIMF